MRAYFFFSVFFFISAIESAFFDRSGNPMPTADILQTDTFGWFYVDHGDAFNYSGSALINKQGAPGTCGFTLIRTWDIKGQNLSASPPVDYKAIGVSSGRCWINSKGSKRIIHRNIEYSEDLGFEVADVVFRHHRTRRSNPINLLVNPNKVLFSIVVRGPSLSGSTLLNSQDGMDVAVIELKETVAYLISQGLQFYPIESAPLKNDTAVTFIGQFDATFSQTYYMRYTVSKSLYQNASATNWTDSFFRYYTNYLGSNKVEMNPNIYGFAHTCTTPGYGGPIFISNTTNSRRLFGIAAEYETSKTLNYGTSLAQMVDCFTSDGKFTLLPESCLRDLKLDLFKRRAHQLEGFKFLTREISTDTNRTVLITSSNISAATFDLNALFSKAAEYQENLNL